MIFLYKKILLKAPQISLNLVKAQAVKQVALNQV